MMAGAMVQSAFSAPARHRVDHRRRHRDHGVRRAAQEAARVQGRQGLPAARAEPGRDAGDAAYARDQLVLGRGRPGGRLQELRQPRHRRRDAARAGRAERQGGAGPLAARAGRRAQPAHRDRARREDPAGRDERRHVHDHQRGRVRGRRRDADHQPGRVRDPVLRRGPQAAVGGATTRSLLRQITTLALSFDHRHIDGEKGSRFLADVAGILEDPASALLF